VAETGEEPVLVLPLVVAAAGVVQDDRDLYLAQHHKATPAEIQVVMVTQAQGAVVPEQLAAILAAAQKELVEWAYNTVFLVQQLFMLVAVGVEHVLLAVGLVVPGEPEAEQQEHQELPHQDRRIPVVVVAEVATTTPGQSATVAVTAVLA